MERLRDVFVHRDEAALIDVVGNWEEAPHLELIEGALVPRRFIVFAPPRHVEVAADQVDRAVVAESDGFVDCCVDC